MINVDPVEIEKFNQLAHRWWDPGAEFRPLHEINPLRLDYIDRLASLRGKRVLDVGCGGGILAESMAARGAVVTGIDLGEKPLKVAQLHLLESGLPVDYRLVSAEALAQETPASFDVVTCMELVEHVPEPGSLVQACADLVRPGGHVFFSTINKLLPRGTHDYARFLKPSELAGMCRSAGLTMTGLTGMTYNPFTRIYALGPDTGVNYLLHTLKT
jgi:2-polyprenyl-6-hydroxyphenyl methylase / 3-demethylubiquinone-9 3-methyltransferase